MVYVENPDEFYNVIRSKNVDLVSEYGDRGFWKAFAEGVDDIEVRQGEIKRPGLRNRQVVTVIAQNQTIT